MKNNIKQIMICYINYFLFVKKIIDLSHYSYSFISLVLNSYLFLKKLNILNKI